jgi:hypothetical protein
MKAFLDTSSLLKLYHQESDTDVLSNALADVKIIYLSEFDLATLNRTHKLKCFQGQALG